MRELPYQAILFDVREEFKFTHFFYATTNSLAVKVGMAADVDKRMKNDRQFTGHVRICKIACNCTPRVIGGRKKCDLEVAWENAHAADRLPASEQYRPFGTTDVYTALRFMVGQDKRGQAVLVWLKKHGSGRVA